MPFDNIKKMIGSDEEADKMRALGLNTLTPAPEEDTDITNKLPGSPEYTAASDARAKQLKNKMSSVTYDPSLSDYLETIGGGTDSEQERGEKAMNMGMGGMGTIGKVKNYAQALKEIQIAKEMAKQTGTELSPFGELINLTPETAKNIVRKVEPEATISSRQQAMREAEKAKFEAIKKLLKK